MLIKNILMILQIVVPVLLIPCILLQQRGTALGSAFGGGDSGGFYSKRRGLDKKIYTSTIILGILFIVVSLLNLII